MKSAVAWNVKGVGYDARETAREAARRAGMSVGEWLNSVIIDQAEQVAGPASGAAREAPAFSVLHDQLDQLATRLGQMGTAARSRPGRRGDHADRRDADTGANLRDLEKWLSGLSKDLARCSEETP